MYKYFLFLICLTSFSLYGQQSPKELKRAVCPKPDREYLPNTVIVKFKPTAAKQIAGASKINVFPTLSKKIAINNAERMFPAVKPLPRLKTNKVGERFVDLSNTYTIKYSSQLSIEEVMNELMNSGTVEYVEPYYIDQVLFIPNDPYADSTTGSQRYYLKAMQFYEALDIEKGDSNVVISVIDTGCKQDHVDLIDNIKVNLGDPINGIDDDGDGYLDNYRGWDFGNNDNNTFNPSSEHGVSVSGVAAATPNNATGMVGIGYNCKLLPIKASTDVSGGAISMGYNGIIYAADHGARVINLSWGGPGGYSQTAQDVINYAAINHDIVVVAAAGNDGLERNYYPASYDHVLSVAALETKYLPSLDTTVEIRAYFATYNYSVDICAQGVEVTGTNHSAVPGYTFVDAGSSFASPIVAGAAGLVRSHYPSLNALQVAELLRVTADPLIDTVAENIEFKNGKLGKGRVNIYKALTNTQTPSIRMYRYTAFNKFGKSVFGGDTISLVAFFRNYLNPTSNAQTTLSVVSSNATLIQGNFTIGTLGTMDSMSSSSNPYRLYLHPSTVTDEKIILKLDYSDPGSGYTDFQYFTITINPSYITIDTNQVKLTISSNGRLGFIDANTSVGEGFMYKGNQLLFEGGLMISTNSTKVVDGVRSSPAGTIDDDFSNITRQHFTTLPEGDQGAYTKFRDKNNSDSIGLNITQRSYAFKNAPNDKYVIVEYDIENVSGSTLDTLYVGLFNDWDIMNASFNKGDWDAQDSVGYTYSTQVGGIYAGISLLTNHKPSCFTLDHSGAGGSNINPNDGFTTIEKFKTLSSGFLRKAGGGSGSGNDISQVVGAMLVSIPNNTKQTVAFAYIAGDNLTNLKAGARQAKNTFRYYNTSQTPVVSNFNYCKGDTVDITITPAPGTKFAFYNTASSTTPINTGTSYSINDVTQSDTIFVSGLDSLFESIRIPVIIKMHADLAANFGYYPKTIDLNTSPNGLAYFINTSPAFTTISWDMGDGTTYDDLAEVGHNFTKAGTYKVVLTIKDSWNCQDTISKLVKVTGTPLSISEFDQDGIIVYPNPVKDQLILHLHQNSASPVNVVIYNSLGQIVQEQYSGEEVLDRKINIPMTGQNHGIHFAKITVGDKTFTRKIIVE